MATQDTHYIEKFDESYIFTLCGMITHVAKVTTNSLVVDCTECKAEQAKTERS